MKSVKQKIESALAGGDNNYAFFDSDELNTLVRMNKVSTFIISAGIDRFISKNDNDGYYPSFGAIVIDRKQAKDIAKDFRTWGVKNDKPLFARVGISEHYDKLTLML
jgi:ABC-type xylose transport system substrate-binding protein